MVMSPKCGTVGVLVGRGAQSVIPSAFRWAEGPRPACQKPTKIRAGPARKNKPRTTRGRISNKITFLHTSAAESLFLIYVNYCPRVVRGLFFWAGPALILVGFWQAGRGQNASKRLKSAQIGRFEPI